MAHLAVVVAVPLAIIPPASLLADRFSALVRPYVDVFQVSHGYAFFGPDPPPASRLVEYRAFLPDGKEEIGRFPDAARHWPRLLYHRHFMLSEKLGGLNEQSASTAAILANSYADHLRLVTGATQVNLFMVEHAWPNPQAILAGIKPDDQRLYSVAPRPIGTSPSAEDIPPPVPRGDRVTIPLEVYP